MAFRTTGTKLSGAAIRRSLSCLLRPTVKCAVDGPSGMMFGSYSKNRVLMLLLRLELPYKFYCCWYRSLMRFCRSNSDETVSWPCGCHGFPTSLIIKTMFSDFGIHSLIPAGHDFCTTSLIIWWRYSGALIKIMVSLLQRPTIRRGRVETAVIGIFLKNHVVRFIVLVSYWR